MLSRDGERIPVSKEERSKRAKNYDYYGASGAIDKIDGYLFEKPLLLIGEDGANLINRSTPIAFIARGKYWVNNHAHVLDGLDEDFLRFLELHINAIDLTPYVTGTAQPKMNQAKMNSIPIALPPPEEQRRIVSRVDELMALCDRLEAAQAERERRRDRLVAASLNRLNEPSSSEPRDHVQFHLNHLPRLTTRREHIKDVRRTILNLAVRGRLVSQQTDDEPAAELIKRIRTYAETRSTTRPMSDEIPFDVPASWHWVRFGELIAHSDAGWSPKTEGFPRSGSNWGVLKVSAVTWEEFRPSENKQLLPGVEPRKSAQVHAGDFLISRANTTELIARAVVVEQEPDNLLLSDKIVRLRIADDCSKKYLRIVNNHAAHARAHYAKEASGTSLSMKNVSRPVIYSLAIPLPPTAEQKRIVAKVDELLAICDKLEAQLSTVETESTRLLEATLQQALAVA